MDLILLCLREVLILGVLWTDWRSPIFSKRVAVLCLLATGSTVGQALGVDHTLTYINSIAFWWCLILVLNHKFLLACEKAECQALRPVYERRIARLEHELQERN